MVALNSTGGKEKTLFELSCSEDLTGGNQLQLTCLLMLNILLSITTVLGNTCLLVTASCCYLFGICVEQKVEYLPLRNVLVFITGYLLCSVSLLTLVVLSVDRLLALSVWG